MSGIAGIVHFRGASPDRDQLRQLSASLAHRGSGDEQLWVEGPAAMALRSFASRLDGRPTRLMVGSSVISLDGWLAEGPAGDLPAAWQRAGLRGLIEVDGAYAFALWDRAEQVLWLVRDGTGTRPLYWSRQGARVAFASEIPPLLGLPWVSRDLATDQVAEYLSFRYVHAPRTLLSQVRSVPPGHALRIDSSGERLERWWVAEWAPPGALPVSAEEAAQAVDGALRRSVERRLSNTVPAAVLLSGGVDSMAILGHAAGQGRSVTAFTVALDEDASEESAFAARVASTLGVPHHIVRIDHRALLDDLPQCTRAMGQPLPSAAAVLQHLLFRQIQPTARLVLSGDGGDEVLGGRGIEAVAARLRRNRLYARALGPLKPALRGLAMKAGFYDLAASQAHFGRERNIGGSHVYSSSERLELLRDPALVRPSIRRTVLDPLYQEVDTDPINAILHVWQRGWLPEDSLARSDRMAAHAGLEVRYPMLDRGVLSTCARLPGPVKVRPDGLQYLTKAPLRDALMQRWPASLVKRPKRSLPNPLDQWLRTAGRDFLRDCIEGICQDEAALFVPAAVRRLRDEHLGGQRDHGLKLWTLCLFRTWRLMFSR
jgi:asparagine synthase (glutamine-hydrolysing)